MAARIVFVVEDGGFVEYERLGECLACGDCCRKFNYSFQYTTELKDGDKDDGNEAKWSDWEGWAVEDWDDDGKWHYWSPCEIIPLDKPRCRCFDPETNHCSEFGGEDWKEICRKFPFRQQDIEGLPNCGFLFQRVND